MMTQEYRPDNGEFTSGGEKITADPEIEFKIAELLYRYRGDLTGQAAQDYHAAKEQGTCIDVLCVDLAAKLNFDASTQLKALRSVRAFSRELYGEMPRHKDFDYTLLADDRDYTYWKQVDRYFMEYMELEARNADGEFYGEPNYRAITEGPTDYAQIATIHNQGIFKSAVLMNGEPIHVYYRIEPLI